MKILTIAAFKQIVFELFEVNIYAHKILSNYLKVIRSK